MSKRPSIKDSIATMAARTREPDAMQLSRDDSSRDSVLALQRDDGEPGLDDVPSANETPTAKKQVRRTAPLPHDSIYMHSKARKAIRQLALDKDVKLQSILRAAVQEYLERNGIVIDLETGKRGKKISDAL